MCRPQSEGGRRCNKHTPYGMRMRALQAKKQYHSNMLKSDGISTRQRAKSERLLATTVADMTALKAEKTALGSVVAHTMDLTPATERVLSALHDAGYEPYIVGGSVRDALMGLQPKDIDIEVYGGDADSIAHVLRSLGRVDEVGKSFGVLKIQLQGEDFDVSLPRRDSKTGDHHRDFEVEVDPELSLEEATARRDYTINALMYSHRLGFIIDKHGGLQDFKDGYLRHVSDAFDEDPLRVLRGVQMASRFNMRLHPDTVEKAQTLRDQYASLAKERVQIEFQKLYLKGQQLTTGIDTLRATGWQQLFPGLVANDTPNRAANIARVDSMLAAGLIDKSSQEKLMAAILATDMTAKDQQQFLGYTTVSQDIAAGAAALTKTVAPIGDDAALRHWVRDLPRQITAGDWLTYQRILGNEQIATGTETHLADLGLATGYEADILNGNDVLRLLPDKKPGPWLRVLLDAARDAQYNRIFNDRQSAVAWLHGNLPV